jgi:hypothetical protein
MADGGNESSGKWWLRYVIVPIIAACIGSLGIGAIVVALIQNSQNDEPTALITSPPSVASAITQGQSGADVTSTTPQFVSPTPTIEIPTPITDATTTAKLVKCETIKTAFPQTLEEVRAKFGLPANGRNFRLVYEECGATATGFIFEGDTEFELSVPEGGCIDSYSGAYFSEQPVSESFGGLRVYGGTVRATGMTYQVAWCETKP